MLSTWEDIRVKTKFENYGSVGSCQYIRKNGSRNRSWSKKVQKTYIPKADELNSEWVLVDVNDEYLGRIASKIASVLLGKHKPGFTPGVMNGDYVVVVNAENIRVTGNKLDDKVYKHHSGYPGGIKQITLRQQLVKHPDRVIKSAVWGMLPHNKYGRNVIKRLKIYAGPEHPHTAQNPKPLA
jgi:large subunit ribosomal protein L13